MTWKSYGGRVVADRAEWRGLRQVSLGASEAAAVLGISPWKSSLELYHEKKGTAPPNESESFARDLGLLLEDPIAQLYRQRTGRVVVRPDPGQFVLCQHKVYPWMVATLDGVQVYTADEADASLRNRAGVLEIKTAAITKLGLWQHEAPIDYQVQVQHQLAVTGCDVGSIVALVGGVALRYSDVKRDPDFIALLEAALAEWWRRFELNDPPPAEGTEATKAFLKRLYAREEPRSVALPAEALTWDADLVQAKAELKKWEAAKTAAEVQFLSALGEANQGVLPDGTVYSLKTQSRKAYVAQASTFRVLRRRGDAVPRPAIPKGRAPVLDVRSAYEAEQEAEQSAAESFEL
jgi:putative phage-type endonuclease